MTDWILHAGNWTLKNSLEGGVLILLLLLLMGIGKRWMGPNFRMVLWVTVGLRLLLPFAPESELSLFNAFQSSAEAVEAPPIAAESFLVPEIEHTRVVNTDTQRSIPWTAILGLVWVSGVFVILSFALFRQYIAAKRIRYLPELEDSGVVQLYEKCLQQAGLANSRIRLAESPREGEICVFGFLRAKRILIPSNLSSQYSEEEMRGILLHELAHVKRCDLVWNWLTLMVQAIHWFNPLVWWAGSRLRAEREIICDQMTLQNLGDRQRRDYGMALLKTLESGQCGHAYGPAFVRFFSRKSELKHRLNMIKNHHQHIHPLLRMIAVAVAVATCAVTFTSAQAQLVEQKDGRHFIYLDSRGSFVEGKSINSSELESLLKTSGKNSAVLTVNPNLPFDKVAPMMDLMRKNGIKDVQLATAKPKSAERIDNPVETSDDELKIYMRDDNASWIQGRQIAIQRLPGMLRDSGKSKVLLSIDTKVTPNGIEYVSGLLKEAGATQVKVAKVVKHENDNELVALARDAKELNVYINNRGTYIRGRSVAHSALSKVIKDSEKKWVTLSVDQSANSSRVDEVKDLIGKGGARVLRTSTAEKSPR